MPILINNSYAGSSDGGTGTAPLVKTLGTDAWNRNKVSIDRSALHGMFTFNIPVDKWKETINDVEQTSFVNAVSTDGKLVLSSDGVLDNKVSLSSFRHPRYEPNRGFLYSSSIFIPSPESEAERSFGVFTRDSGAMFRVKSDGNLYAVRRTTLSGVVSEVEDLITMPDGVDLTKGNTYDIQFQWRGVGNMYWYINQILVHTSQLIGTLDELSIFNPALPIAFECINKGEDTDLICGCADVSIEGGGVDGKTYGSIAVNNDTGSVEVTGLNIPVIATKNLNTLGTLVNTRDVRILRFTGYADQRCVMRIWKTRDESAITLNDQVYSDYGDGHLQRVIYGLNADGTATGITTAMTFDTTKANLVYSTRVDQDTNSTASSLFEGATEPYQTSGDIFVLTMHRETGGTVNVGGSYEFAETI